MENNKKGAGRTPTPRGKTSKKNTDNSITLRRLCPTILIIAAGCFLVAYQKQAINAMYLCAGILITTGVFEVALNPINDEEDDEDE